MKPGQKETKNIFGDGMILDSHASKSKANTTRKVTNFRVITRDNNSFILTSIKGTEHKGSITTNYVPLAIADWYGVAYIVSAEVIAGVATGRGEIGTFPSPSYAGVDGDLEFDYKPLKNYGGDNDEYPLKDGNFRSDNFDFDLINLMDIELQNDYDRSINIIFTDGKNPIRIVNSGFTVLPGNKYTIVDRSNANDTNKYAAANFSNTLNLILKSKVFARVKFENSESGGSLPFGNMQYFFAYATSDGNETEIFAQSQIVPVFNGNTFLTITGGKNSGDKTTKRNRFTIYNVDRSFDHIVVYVVHADGMTGQVITNYRIDKKFYINNDSVEIIHSGYESIIPSPITDLQDNQDNIDTAKNLAQSQGHLFIANIKEKSYDETLLEEFARHIKLGHKAKTLDAIGPELNSTGTSPTADANTNRYDENLSTRPRALTDGYNGGYMNPKNVHDRLGYWGGETYPYAARFIYTDGASSRLFPVSGIDNLTNDNLAIIDGLTSAALDGYALNNDGYAADGNSAYMVNTKGIYRFPNRNEMSSGEEIMKLVNVTGKTTKEARITIFGVTFKIPEVTQDILDITIGIQFFRGKRIPDVLAQGLFIDAEIIPPIRFDNPGAPAEKLKNWPFSSSSYKLIPSFDHEFESIHLWDAAGGSERTSLEDNSNNKKGIAPTKLKEVNRARATFIPDNVPFCFFSTDSIVNPIDFSGFSSQDIFVKMLYQPLHKKRIKTCRVNLNDNAGDHYSALVPWSLAYAAGTREATAKASWVPEKSEEFNDLRFSSLAFFQARFSDLTDKYALYRLSYNQYLGIMTNKVSGSIVIPSLGTFASGTGESATTNYNTLNGSVSASYIGNIYIGSQQRNQAAIKSIYQNVSDVQYFPISDKLYWNNGIEGADAFNNLEDQLDNAVTTRKITLYGGDCYINFAFRKLHNNAELDDTEKNQTNRVLTGPHIGLINEANFNASFRSPETINLIEGQRKHPSQYIPKVHVVGTIRGHNNQWRDYRLLEANIGNKGYGMTDGNLLYAIRDVDSLFTELNWFSRVWHTPKHIPTSFENAYRKFLPGDYQDYGSKPGEIIKIINNNGKLYCIQEKAVGVIPVNERIQTGSDSAGAVYVESSGVLGPYMGNVSNEHGSRHRNSIISTDNHVYGVNLDRFTIWRTESSKDNKSLAQLSLLSIGSFLEQVYKGYNNVEIELMVHDIVATWDKGNNEIMFTFYNKESGNFNSIRNFTVSFNEITKNWHFFWTAIPHRYFKIDDNQYSFNVKTDNNKIWLHDSDNVPYGSFYGTENGATIAFAVTPDGDFDKIFDSIKIVSNRVKPSTINFYTQSAQASVVTSDIPGDIVLSNIKYKRGAWELSIPKVDTVHNKDIEKQETEARASALSVLGIRSRLKGKQMIIELVYTSNTLIELESVITNYQLNK